MRPRRALAAAAAAASALLGRDLAALRRERSTLGDVRVRVNGREVYVRVAGPADAPPVVLVHGFVISSAYMIPLATRLARTLRVYAPDLPGFGRSEKPPATLDVDGLADALRLTLDAAAIARPAIVANSLGCQVAAALAARHPERVGRLVLVGPTVEAGARSGWRQALRLLRGGAHERPSLLVVQARDWLRFGPRRIWRLMHHTLADRIEDRLPRIVAPTLVVRGGNDRVLSREWAETVTRLLPCARYVEIPGEGHALNYSAAEELVEVIEPFLKQP